VVVVVTDALLVPGRLVRRFDASHQAGAVHCVQHVVDRLGGHRAERLLDACEQGVGVQVLAGADRVEHRDPLPGHPETRFRDALGGVRHANQHIWNC
jgi:hypothetical protein